MARLPEATETSVAGEFSPSDESFSGARTSAATDGEYLMKREEGTMSTEVTEWMARWDDINEQLRAIQSGQSKQFRDFMQVAHAALESHRMIMEEAVMEEVKEELDIESARIRAAEFFTLQLFHSEKKMPNHTEISVKLLQTMIRNCGIPNPLFFDSKDPMMSEMKDDMPNLIDILNPSHKGFVLSLHTDLNEEEQKTKVMEMQACIDAEKPHSELDDIRKKLAIAHGLGSDQWEKIKITSVFEGSLCYQYTVVDLTAEQVGKFKKDCEGLETRLRDNFEDFKSAKIHPLLYRPAFDISNFDERGNKEFGSLPRTHRIGPSADLKREYTQPSGWTRYGLSVLGKYDSDTWIHPFSEQNMWWKAYHGTRQASKAGFHPADAIANIAFGSGFHVSEAGKDLGGTGKSAAVHGKGVYCATKPEYAYSARETLQLQSGPKEFEYLIMCAVKPSKDGVKVVNHGKWWVVQDKKDIRPYGILVREVNQSGCLVQ